MAEWKIRIVHVEEPDEDDVTIEYLEIPNWVMLEIVYLENGRFFVQVSDDMNKEIDVGEYDTLPDAKRGAEVWALDAISEYLAELRISWKITANL